MSLGHIWSGWRSDYIQEAVARNRGVDDGSAHGATLFERVLALPDAEAHVLVRGTECSALLNAYPYTNGHLMVLPNRPVADLEDLTPSEYAEMWSIVRDAVGALKATYDPDGINVGLNLGTAAGAGVPDHLHVHALPRWLGDTNFTTTVAEARVLPEALSSSWERLRANWPS
jgi:ATP adenylyltransferase